MIPNQFEVSRLETTDSSATLDQRNPEFKTGASITKSVVILPGKENVS